MTARRGTKRLASESAPQSAASAFQVIRSRLCPSLPSPSGERSGVCPPPVCPNVVVVCPFEPLTVGM